MADGHRITVSQLRAASRQPIKMRGPIRRAAIATQHLSAHIIGEDENNVRLVRRVKCGRGEKTEANGEAAKRNHETASDIGRAIVPVRRETFKATADSEAR